MPFQAKHTAQPLELPAIPHAALKHLNAASRKREPWHGELGGENVIISPEDATKLWQEEDTWCGLKLQINEAPLTAFLPFSIIHNQVHQIDETIDLEQLDADSCGLLAEAVFESFIQSLENELHGRIVCNGIIFAPDYPEGELYSFRVETDSWGRQPLILQPAPALGKQLQRWLNDLPLQQKNIDDLPITISFRAGVTVLTVDDLIHLRPGDGIILDENSVSQKTVIAVVGEAFAQSCMVTSKGLELTAPLLTPATGNLKGWIFMNDYDESYPGEHASDPGAVGQINVRLVFEVGRKDMTVSDLQGIDTGHIFDLGRPVGQAVDILAGGRQIGAGELVRVGEQIGVRVDWILK